MRNINELVPAGGYASRLLSCPFGGKWDDSMLEPGRKKLCLS